MHTKFRSVGMALTVVFVMAIVVGFSRPMRMESLVADTLQAAGPLKWYRGNMHTHSHWSDGDDYLESIAKWYLEHKYDFLVFTDHNTLSNSDRWVEIDKTRGGRKAFDRLKEKFPGDWIETRTVEQKEEVRLKRFDEVYAKFNRKDKYLLIQGEEISDRFGKLPIHMNVSNVAEVIPPLGGSSVSDAMQNNVNALMAQRERTRRAMMIHLNHPNFQWGITAEDLAPIRGENFFEVYNGHPGVNNNGDDTHASAERIWDIINAKRLTELDLPLMYGMATDDSHSYHSIPSRGSEPGRGWVMVLSDQLEPESLVHAMEVGRFYASSGVTLEKVVATPTDLEIAVAQDPDAAYVIEFIGTKKGFDRSSEPVLGEDGKPLPVTRKYSNEIGKVLKSVTGTSAKYTFASDDLYVRARVTSSRFHPNPSIIGDPERAWTQPVHP